MTKKTNNNLFGRDGVFSILCKFTRNGLIPLTDKELEERDKEIEERDKEIEKETLKLKSKEKNG